MSYDKENRMAAFAKDATLNAYTYDSDGFKKVENVGGSLSTIIWYVTDDLGVSGLVRIMDYSKCSSFFSHR